MKSSCLSASGFYGQAGNCQPGTSIDTAVLSGGWGVLCAVRCALMILAARGWSRSLLRSVMDGKGKESSWRGNVVWRGVK
jgi:hypothetical protein